MYGSVTSNVRFRPEPYYLKFLQYSTAGEKDKRKPRKT
jgi:hypothetical protein